MSSESSLLTAIIFKMLKFTMYILLIASMITLVHCNIGLISVSGPSFLFI